MDQSNSSSVSVRSDGVAEIDASGPWADRNLVSALRRGDVTAVRVYNLVAPSACEQLARRLVTSRSTVDHADVEGLRVVGLSHFQAVRDVDLRQRYAEEARTSAGVLRSLASPYGSPFDSAVAFLAQSWPAGCQFMSLPTEGLLSPFTIRIYGDGVGIEPHQDILSAESPTDPIAQSLAEQFGANIYLSVGSSGGSLEIFDADQSATGYSDLSGGPHVVARERLPVPLVTITPAVGDLILFPSRLVHAVAPCHGNPRITVSFFVGLQDDQSPLQVWA